MRDAFGVERVIKRDQPKRVPDWALATMPASAAAAYNRSTKHKGEAAASNMAVKSGAGAAAAGTIAGGVYLLARGKKLPKFMLNPSQITVPKLGTAHISAGEKQRTLASIVGGSAATATGGYAGQRHLKSVERNPRYGGAKSRGKI